MLEHVKTVMHVVCRYLLGQLQTDIVCIRFDEKTRYFGPYLRNQYYQRHTVDPIYALNLTVLITPRIIKKAANSVTISLSHMQARFQGLRMISAPISACPESIWLRSLLAALH